LILVALAATSVQAESTFQHTPAADGGAFYINPGLNDAWFNPATNGQGFLITVFPDTGLVFLAWFTYDSERPPEDVTALLGEPGHRWLTAQGPFSGDTANLVLFETAGGVFDRADPAPVTDQAGIGTLLLEFADCRNGMVSYEIPALGLSGEVPIQRIVEDNVPLCEVLAAEAVPACTRADPDISHGENNPTIKNGSIVDPLNIVGGGPGPDGIPALEMPEFINSPGMNSLGLDELVVGIKIGDDVRAYPHRILDWHEIVNEQYLMDGQAQNVSLSYCPLTGSAVLWKAIAGFSNPTFGTSGTLYNSNLVLYDRETKSLWSQMLEQAIRGSETANIPDRLQLVETRWETWKNMYPDTKILSENTGYSRDYNEYPYGDFKTNRSLLFPVINESFGPLHKKARVLGVNVGESSKIYPIKSFASGIEIINDVVGDMKVVAAGSSGLDLGVVYNRELEDCTVLEFEALQDQLPAVMRDNEGNEWDIFGVAVSGPRTGQQLEKTNSYIAYFYAWYAFFPHAEIHP
jgi:hypothetical protein